MNKFIMLVVALVTTFFATNILAFTPPAPPVNGRHIVDQAHKLNDQQFDALEKKIESMNSSTKNEFGVLILSSMDGDNIEDVANATFKSWGVGKRGLDNGVLLVISVAERKSRLETGKGVGGDLPDLKCNDILKNNLAPHLRKGDFYGGIDSTLAAVGSQLESRANQKADPRPVDPSCSTSAPGFSTGTVWFLVLVGGGIGGILYARSRARRRREEEARKQYELNVIRRRKDAEERARAEREEERERIARMQKIVTPVVTVPEMPRKPTVPRPTPKSTTVKTTTVSAAVLAAEAAEAANRARRAREEREVEERRARKRREEEEDRRRRQREEDDRRSSSSSSSSSSFDWGGSSGSGFGGGDSGGGGSSGDW